MNSLRTLGWPRRHDLNKGPANAHRFGVRLPSQGSTRPLLEHHRWPSALPAAGTVIIVRTRCV